MKKQLITAVLTLLFFNFNEYSPNLFFPSVPLLKNITNIIIDPTNGINVAAVHHGFNPQLRHRLAVTASITHSKDISNAMPIRITSALVLSISGVAINNTMNVITNVPQY